MFKSFVLAAFLILTIRSQCSDGCINCSESDLCLYCDVTSKYYLSNGRCEKYTDKKCSKFDIVGKCLSCVEKTFLDLNINTCVDVTTEIPNCQFYFSEKTCLTCNKGFMVSNGGCAVVTKVIENCDSQQESKCLICSPGYIVSLSADSCKPDPLTYACSSYQNVECKQCNANFVKNQNFYLNQIFGFKIRSQLDLLTSFLQNQQNKIIDNFAVNVCQRGEVPKCASHISFNKCGRCEAGFFVNKDGLCESYPVPTIPNCLGYSSLTVCNLCAPGFQLTKDSLCEAVVKIDNCLQYNPKSVSSGCAICVPGFKLLGRRCIPRKISIENCKDFAENRDACKVCKDGFSNTNDDQKCLPSISGCHRYAPSNRFSTNLKCELCESGFYVDTATNSCVKGTIENCLIYEKTKNACTICQNKYILQEKSCINQDIIVGCDNYHSRSPNVCSTCKNSSYLTKHVVRCQSVEKVSNCQIYITKNICFRCQDGYQLSNNVCVLINPAENCLQKTKNYCTRCLKDFINDDGVCKSPLDYININCEKANIDGVNQYRQNFCSVCKDNSFPWNYRDSYICVEKTYFTPALDNNCLQFYLDKTTYKCAKCENKLFLTPEGTCVSTCATTVYRQTLRKEVRRGNNRLDTLVIGSINYCGDKIKNCAVAAPDLDQPFPNSPRYTCIKCDVGKNPVINFFSASATIIKNADDTTELMYGVSPVTFLPGTQCIDLATNTSPALLPNPVNIVGVSPSDYVKKLGEFVGTSVADCQYYGLIEPGIGCVKCRHAYTGSVFPVVNQCAKYSDSYTCSECNQGFYLFRTYECKQVSQILNCAKYDGTATTSKCSACTADYYVNVAGTACVVRLRSLSVTNGTPVINADDVTCSNSYIKLPPSSSSSTAKFVCTQLPSNCKTAEITSDLISGCTECNETTSYIQNKLCITGTISNCGAYTQGGAINTCTTCKEGYYLKTGQCLAHHINANPNCLNFHTTSENICLTCKFDSFLFTPKTQCRLIISIANCIEYESTDKCKTCKNGYRLANLKTTCNLILPNENCSVMEPVDIAGTTAGITTADADHKGEFAYECKTCLPGYYKISTQISFTSSTGATTNVNSVICKNWLNYKLENCEKHDIINTDDFTKSCLSCKADFIPLDFNGKYICTDRDYHANVRNTLNIANCEMISIDAGNYKCVKCTYGKVLVADVCQNFCDAANVFTYRDYTIDTDKYVPATSVNCAAAPAAPAGANIPPECDKITPTLDDGTAVVYGCIGCKENFIPTYNIKLPGVPFDPAKGDIVDGPFNAYPIIHKCLDKTKVRYATGSDKNTYSSTPIPNCRYYIHLETDGGNEYIGCATCSIGFKGSLTKYTSVATLELALIPECTAMSTTGAGGCKSSSNLNLGHGLGFSSAYIKNGGPLTLLYSCLECADASELPAIALAFTGLVPNLQQQWDRTSSPYRPAVLTNVKSESSFCIAKPSSIPANCGTIAYNVLADAPAITSGTSVFCTSCKPGFSPTLDPAAGATDMAKVTACTAITNCPAGSSWFNTCSSCVFQYDYSTKLVNYQKCLNNTSTAFVNSCFAGNNYGECLICKKGYDMSPLGTCVQSKVPGCSSANIYNPLKNFAKSFSPISAVTEIYSTTLLNIAVFFLNDKLGCLSCPSTQILTEVSTDAASPDFNKVQSTVCVSKDLIDIKLFTIANCASLETSTTLKCYVCATGYVKTTDGKCIPQSTSRYLTNCAQALVDTVTYCQTCSNPTADVNIGGMCVPRISTIPNCKEFDNAFSLKKSQAKCTLCEDSYYPTSDGKVCSLIPDTFPNCAKLNAGGTACDTCKPNFVLVTLTGGVLYCFPTRQTIMYDSNCLVYDSAKFNLRELTCSKCTDGYFAVDVSTPVINYCYNFQLTPNPNPYCKTYDLPVGNAALTTVSLKCTECKVVGEQFLNKTTNICSLRQFKDVNCKNYVIDSDECFECNDNYILEPIFKRTCVRIPFINNFNPINKSYISSCIKMASCIDTVFYEGLPRIVNSILSCHSCSVQGQIPFLVGKGGWPYKGIQGLQSYTLNTTANNIGSGGRFMDQSGDASTRCLAPVASSFGINPVNFAFPSNCGVGFLNANANGDASNSDRLTNVDRSKIAVICAACLPKFAPNPAYDATNKIITGMIGSCTAIANCESSKWFNYCSQCMPNYVFAYEPDFGVKYDKCISYEANPNCHAVDVTSSPNKKTCKFCKVGYTLNVDGVCEAIRPPRCQISTFRFKELYSVEELSTGLVLSKEGIGCQRCDTGFVAIHNKEPRYLCTISPYQIDKKFTAESNFIYKCKNYVLNQGKRLICQRCEDGWILRTDGRCIEANQQPNCIVAFDSQYCSECNRTNSVNIDHSCQAPSINNCLLYANDFDYSQAICAVCNKGTFLDANICRANPISNCEVSDSNRTCTRCSSDFQKLRSINTTDYCIALDPTLNCVKLDLNWLQKSKVVCTQCNSTSNFYLSDKPEVNSFCLNALSLDNCLKYDIKPSISFSTFTCVECISNYYLNPSMNCTRRLVYDINCKTYSNFADICLNCLAGYFVSADGRSCVKFPDGISGCREYSYREKCAACVENYYLSQNECLPVPKKNLIENCQYYDDVNTCKKCKNAFAVIEGKCIASTAQNCEEYVSITACSSCPVNYGLKEENGLINCVSITTENCSVSEKIFPFKCITCKSKYYNKDGTCVPVTTSIDNCLIYSSADSCSTCDVGTALAPNAMSCTKISSISGVIDPNCQISEIKAQNQCLTCKSGFYFKNGSCINCDAGQGCQGCLDTNPNECLLCAPGYYMNFKKKCIPNGQAYAAFDEGDKKTSPNYYADFSKFY